MIYQIHSYLFSICSKANLLELSIQIFQELDISKRKEYIDIIKYREELQQLIYEYCYRLLETGEEKMNLYEGFSRADKKLFLQYHSYALLGILQQWTDEDTEHLDEIVHKLYLLACSPPPKN